MTNDHRDRHQGRGNTVRGKVRRTPLVFIDPLKALIIRHDEIIANDRMKMITEAVCDNLTRQFFKGEGAIVEATINTYGNYPTPT